MSIAELTNHWVDRVLGVDKDEEKTKFCYPRVWPADANLKEAARFVMNLRKAGCKKIIAINFGVGGNARKRLASDFEEKLLLSLLKEPDTVLLLDQGFGEEEITRSRSLMGSLERRGFAAAWTRFDALSDISISGGVISVMTGIGEIASLISQCDEFIGYDSACQHIAAALGVPTYTVFAGSNNPRFIRRWSACGPSKSKIIHVDTLTHPPMFDMDDIVTRIADARNE
jgi:ADP-heptose:LPS heptosyltransferase